MKLGEAAPHGPLRVVRDAEFDDLALLGASDGRVLVYAGDARSLERLAETSATAGGAAAGARPGAVRRRRVRGWSRRASAALPCRSRWGSLARSGPKPPSTTCIAGSMLR